jgi:fructokinase
MDVLCLGEVLIDMIGQETGSLVNVESYRRFPGGAAANVAVGVAKLGHSSAFLGRVSTDPFGDFLAKTLQGWGVDTRGMVRDSSRQTSIAFVSMDANKVPSFSFYRDSSASKYLCPEDLDEALFASARFLYFSSISLANSPIRDANYEAVRLAQRHGCLIAFDPNIRLSVWGSKDAASREIHKMLSNISVLKLNDQELHLLFGEGNLDQVCANVLRNYPQLRLVAVTLGERGCCLMDAAGTFIEARAAPLPVIDTTGAGDSFTSALLFCWLRENGISGAASLESAGVYANSAAHITARRHGVIPALPGQEEIESFMKEHTK